MIIRPQDYIALLIWIKYILNINILAKFCNFPLTLLNKQKRCENTKKDQKTLFWWGNTPVKHPLAGQNTQQLLQKIKDFNRKYNLKIQQNHPIVEILLNRGILCWEVGWEALDFPLCINKW